MNRKINSLLIGALVFGLQNIGAYTNKTFLQPRNQALTNLPLEMTTFSERTSAKLKNRWGFNLEAVGFYGQSENKSELGEYFGICHSSKAIMLRGQDPLFLTMNDGMFDVGYLIHDSAAAARSLPGRTMISLRPKSIHYGIDFVYYQDLSKLAQGLYFKVNLPVEYVQNDPNFVVTGGDIFAVPVPGHLATKANIYNFFKGNPIEGQAPIDAQLPLTAGKINGKQSASGVADIDVMLGYKFLNKDDRHASINIGFNIPTGKKSTGEYMFEPLYGTPSFAFGGGLEGCLRIWGNEKENFKINVAANYRYFFQSTEHRIPGLDFDNFGQYELLGKANKSITDPIVLQPAANLLNHKVYVTMNSQIDALIGLTYNNGGFTFDLGYNLYHREGEKVKQRSATFTPKTYGTASKGLIISGANSGGTTLVGRTDADLRPAVFGDESEGSSQFDSVDATTSAWLVDDIDLSFGSAETPSQLTNSIYTGMGYAFNEWRCPLMLGIGCKYEFASKNSSLEIWQVNAKAGLSF